MIGRISAFVPRALSLGPLTARAWALNGLTVISTAQTIGRCVTRALHIVCALAVVVWAQAAMAAERPVTVEPVRKMPIAEILELSGSVSARRVAQLSTELPGSVETVHHDAGAHVKAGEPLVELDRKLAELARQQALAQIAEAEAQLADANRRLKIAVNLAKRAFGPQNEVDSIKTDIAIRQAALERLKAERESTDERLIRHAVRAPFSGVISRKLTEVGQWVVPGTPVLELVELENLRIEFPVPQQFFSVINDRVSITLTFSTLPNARFPARIDAIIPVSDPNARTFILRVLPLDDRLSIAPGMSAQARISIPSGRDGLVISRDALLRQPDGRITVWVVESTDGKLVARERRVEIGLSFDGLTEIRSGLKIGDRVVVRGNEALTDGQSVRPAS